ncbi:MAG TPA: TonB-dependent receptor, partial [Chitinophagaceae bacterium]|nr:TonB-dependent receptor [Chitinophagaceae bacterium]
MKKSTLFFLMLTISAALFSQKITINGRITDKQTNEALARATITLKGTSTSTISDNLGNFELSDLKPGNIVLIISYAGYETIELPVTTNASNARIDVALPTDERIGNAIVVSASKRPEKITNAPASIQVIGAKELNEFAGSNVNELVSKVQGVEYTRNGVTDITLNARGFNSAFNNKILLLVDGRISTAALSGNLPMMNTRGTMIKDDIERMEIVLGPQSALYGPNALNAIVNTTTKDPRKYQGTTASISAGNHYQFSGRIRHATKINNKWAYKVVGEYFTGKEYNFYDSVYVTKYSPYDSSVKEHNVNFDFRHIRGEANVYYSITTKTDLIVSAGGSNNYWTQVTSGGRNQMRGVTYSFIQARLVNPNYYLNIYNTWGNIGRSYPITPYTRDFWNRTHRPNNPAKPEIAEDSALYNFQFKEESQRLNADAQYNHEFKKAGLFLIGGLNYQKERPNGFGRNLLDSFQRIDITQYGAVLQLEKSLPWSIRFVTAVRWDNHSNFGNFFSPKLGLVKDLGDGCFRITWGRAYAMPTILNQYSYLQKSTFGNGEGITYLPNGFTDDPKYYKKIEPLKPEQVSTWEFGYKGTIAKKLFVDINYYDGLSKNFLGTTKSLAGRILNAGDVKVYSASPGSIGSDGKLSGASFFTYFNYSEVKAYGLDAGLTYSFNKFISLSLKYSWFNSDITDDDIKNDANGDGYVSLEETSLNAPNHRGLINLSLQNLCKQRVFVNVSARMVQQYDFYSGVQIGTEAGKGKRGIVYGGIGPNGQPRYYLKNFDWGPLGGFTTIDLSAGYRLNQMTQLTMSITNLLNTNQIEFVGSP